MHPRLPCPKSPLFKILSILVVILAAKKILTRAVPVVHINDHDSRVLTHVIANRRLALEITKDEASACENLSAKKREPHYNMTS
jgi:hypothetical protein